MNRKEISTRAQSDMNSFKNKSIFTTPVQFKQASKNFGSLTLTVEDINNFSNDEESFLTNSGLIKTILSRAPDAQSLTLTELGTLAMYAKMIEEGDVKAATYLRDTSGEKPIDKVHKTDNAATKLSDEELDYLLTVGVEDDE